MSRALGEQIKAARDARGLTLEDVAEALGVSRPTVWAWEHGKAKPRLDRTEAILKLLGVSVSTASDRDHPAWQRLERGIEHPEHKHMPAYWTDRPGQYEIELSKAISAKRIADGLDRLVSILSPENGTDITSLIYYLTNAIEQRNR